MVGPESRPALYRLAWTALIFWAFAGTVYLARRAAFGDRPASIHVRWAPMVDEARRQELEHRYSLQAPSATDGRTFGYTLIDVSRPNIEALVSDPDVEDTHEIHRTAYRVGYFSPRLPYAARYPSIPAALDALAILLFVLGAAWTTVRGGIPRLARWIGQGIPDASPEAVAVFRILLGASLLIVVLRRPVFAAWAAEPSNVISPVQHALLQMFVHAPWLADGLWLWLTLWGCLFIAGAFARAAFACLSAGIFAWALLYTTNTTYHTVSSLLVTLVVLQWSRWSDAWSVDAWRRGNSGPYATPKAYGYTVWVPGLVLGVVFAAAAVAKLRDSGFAWILNGTVRYHFLSDSIQAMVDWGLWIGRHEWLSVLLSFGAIAIESLVIAAVLMGAYRYRLIAGAAALSLLLGFTLLQGLFWPGWWMLLLSFLPWHLVPGTRHLATAPMLAALPRAQVVVVMALVGVQLGVSLLKLEVSPLLSTYDMYATTYASPAEYEQKAGQAYWIVGVDTASGTHRCRITRDEADAMAHQAASAPPAAESMLRRCFDPSLEIRNVSIEATRVRIDWARWERLDEPVRVPLTGAIPIDDDGSGDAVR